MSTVFCSNNCNKQKRVPEHILVAKARTNLQLLLKTENLRASPVVDPCALGGRNILQWVKHVITSNFVVFLIFYFIRNSVKQKPQPPKF